MTTTDSKETIWGRGLPAEQPKTISLSRDTLDAIGSALYQMMKVGPEETRAKFRAAFEEFQSK